LDRLESFGHLREVDTDNSRVTAVISTGDVARDGAIIDPAGWDFSNYDRNPVVLWMHDDSAMPFARTIEHEAGKNELVARAEFDTDDPMGAQIFRKIANGYINATSVRWLPKKTETRIEGKGDDQHEVLVFVEQELLEWSFVTIPSDPGSLIMRADGSPFRAADYKAQPYLPNLAWLHALGPNVDLSWLRELKPPTNGNGHHDTQALERLLVRYFERRNRRLDADDMVVSALSRATGKSEERIRREMAEGGL
jgi:HK97 family phage prohead protease